MQFQDYNAFRVAVQHLFEGDDTTSNSFSVNTLDLIIGLGEERVYHGDAATPGLRSSTMLEPLSLTVTDNAADLPSDLLELHEVYFSGEKPLDIVPLNRLRRLGDDYVGGGRAVYAAQDGETLRFWPNAEGPALGSYYAKPESLETVTWADATTFARYPQLFLYAALYEGAIFLGMVNKLGMWEMKYRQLAEGANHSERMRAYGGGPLRMRTR